MSESVSVVRLKAGQEGIVTAILGGAGMARKLNALGIYEGKRITKVSAQWMHGPVVIRIGSTDVAVGFGMAGKIMVSPEGESP